MFPSLINDLGDYDTHGYYKEIYNTANGDFDQITKALTPGDPFQHMGSDRYKKPSHPTFSNESKYAIPLIRPGGHWEDNFFVAKRRNLRNLSNSEQGSAYGYFQDAEDLNGDKIPDIGLKYKKNVLILPQEKLETGGKMATPGTTFKELIKYATSKDAPTKDDFESAMSARGYKPGDVRKLGRAFDRMSSSGDEYVLHPTKGFNVFEGGKQKTGSGKRKGNKAGADLGDLIGLGNEVSLLAGALRHESAGYERSKAVSQKAITPEHPAQKAPDVHLGSGPSTTTSLAKKPERPPKLPDVTATAKPGNPMYYESPSKSKEPKTFSWEDITGSEAFNKLYSQKNPAEPGIDWAKLVLGDIPLLWDVENYKDITSAYNPAQIWNPQARDNARQRSARPGHTVGAGDSGMGDFGLLTPFVKSGVRGLLNAPAGQQVERAGMGAFDKAKAMLRSLYERSANKVRYPEVVKEPLGLPEYKGPFEIGTGYEPGFGVAGTPEYFPPGGYEQGGKLPQAGDGWKFDDPNGMDFWGNNPWDERPSSGTYPIVSATQGERPIVPGATQREKVPIVPSEGYGHPNRSGDILSGLVRYGVPAAFLGAEQAQIHRLRGLINPHLTAPNLMVGAVQDLPRPDFSLPYEPSLGGSSLQEAQNTGLARQRYTRQARNDFELRNALNRQQQRNVIIDRLNQQAQLSSGIVNEEQMIKANNAAREMGFLFGDRGATASSLFQNLDQGIADTQDARDAKDLSLANAIMRNPDNPEFTETDKERARAILGVGRKKKKKAAGGRFSKQTY